MITATKIREVLDIRLSEAAEIANRLRAAERSPGKVDRLLAEMKELFGGRSVQTIEGDDDIEGYGKVALIYVDRGSKEDETLLYDTEAQRFSIGSWGAWIEEHDGDLEEDDGGGEDEEEDEEPDEDDDLEEPEEE